jgi:hypothetical protein
MAWRKTLKAYRHDLDQVLLTGSIEQVKAFMIAHGVRATSDAVVEITMHKTIPAAKSLTVDYRRKSKAWLIERDYTSWDDGDL